MVKVRKLLNVSLITVLKNNFIFLKKKKKTHLTTKSYLYFSVFCSLLYVFKNRKQSIFGKHLLFVLSYFYLFFKSYFKK